MWLHAVDTDKFTFFFTLLFYPEDADSRALRNVCTFLPDHKKSHPRKHFFLWTPPWDAFLTSLTDFHVTQYGRFRESRCFHCYCVYEMETVRIWRMFLHVVRIGVVTIWNFNDDVRQGCQDTNAVVFRECVLLLSWIIQFDACKRYSYFTLTPVTPNTAVVFPFVALSILFLLFSLPT